MPTVSTGGGFRIVRLAIGGEPVEPAMHRRRWRRQPLGARLNAGNVFGIS